MKKLSSLTSLVVLGSSWSGVDKTVVEHYAEKAGHHAWKPFINTDQGDLLLFIFLLAGTIGGFIAGYYWRVLFTDKTSLEKETKTNARQ